MKTEITKLDNDWKYVKNVSRTTVGKKHTENDASDKFKIDMLISEHSPIREIKVKWIWKNIKSWIITHFVRHKYETYISTQRSDRTGVNRDKSTQDTKVRADSSANAQNLIDMMRKRLCYQCHSETVEYARDLKMSIKQSGEEELFQVLVPNCVYRCGCPEFYPCSYFDKLCKKDSKIKSNDIKERYQAYNNIFEKEFDDEEE